MSQRSSTVIVEVRGGVCYLVDKPKDVTLIIRDYDVDGEDSDLLQSDESGTYMEGIHQ